MRGGLCGAVCTAALVTAVFLWAPVFLVAQAPSATPAKTAPARTAATKTWTLPRTPDGQPDLQGYWTSLSFTPMERPAKYGGREFLTDEETAELYKAGVQRSYEFTFANSSETPVYDATVYALDAWQNGVKPNRRTSLVVDPPDGRIPALTPEAQARRGARRAPAADAEGGGIQIFNGPEDLGLGVRCLNSGGGPPILPGAYDNNSLIVQGPGYVVLEYEWGSEVRVVPLDGRPHVSPNIRPWHGDPRGHWEGNTLVVETTNFRPGSIYQNANPKTLRITERFTRVDADTIEYKFTVDDPSTWTKPWSAIVPMSKVDGPMFEYACNEGNNGLINMLEGSRAKEKADALKKGSK